MIKAIKKLSRKHYIQCLMTALLTGVVLYFTSALWLIKNIIVSFNTETEKDIQYQVFYTDASSHSMATESYPVKAGSNFVRIEVPTENIKIFRLDPGSSNPGNIIISDLQIKGSYNIKLNYSEFEHRNIDKFEVKDGKLYLISNHNDPYFWYRKDLNLSAGLRIDWCRFIIISVLAFLLMYKFVQYLSKFKIEKHHSRIDIVMLAVFFALLFVPMSHISDAEKSEQENRMLAKKPQLMMDNKNEDNYGVQFDDWYNDHFFGRDMVVEAYQKFKYLINPMIGTNKILVGSNGWLFLKDDNSLDNYANITELKENHLENGLKYLSEINEWCKKHNKKFYYIIIPDKHRIYGEYYRLIKKQRSDDFGIARQFVNYIREHSDVNVIYLQDDLLKHKDKGLLYFKEGTHWSDMGAYYAYGDIIDYMSKDYSLHKVKADEWCNTRASDNGLLVMQSKGNKISYGEIYKRPIYIRKAECEEKSMFNRLGDGEINCINNHNEYNLFVLRDSFFSWLTPYIADTFKKTKILWKKNIEADDLKDIEQNFDIVILENVERFIPQILNQKFPQNLTKEN